MVFLAVLFSLPFFCLIETNDTLLNGKVEKPFGDIINKRTSIHPEIRIRKIMSNAGTYINYLM